jgi:hypothetical protein
MYEIMRRLMCLRRDLTPRPGGGFGTEQPSPPHARSIAAGQGCSRVAALSAMVTLAALSAAVPAAARDVINGFDLSDPLVPREYIAAGGPARDGIPALTDPRFVTARQARFLDPEDRVLGVYRNGVAKAYPLPIMNWHEVVNDRFGDEYVVVTYCPLCFSGMAFAAELEGERHEFGVSGLLYNSDVLLFDRPTESLWSQIDSFAITGPYKGRRLEPVPLVNTAWREWKRRHPGTLVLSLETGHRRNYDRDPYAWYDQSPDLMFPVRFRALGYHPKEYVLGITLDGEAKAYPVSELARAPERFEDEVGGTAIVVHYDDENVSGEIRDADGELLPGVMAYWFAWFAFHPETGIYKAE